MSKKNKSFEVLWKKKYWKSVIDNIIPSKRIFIKKYLVFDEFVIFFKYVSKDDDYLIKIKPEISVSNKALNLVMDSVGQAEKQYSKAKKGIKSSKEDLEELERITNDSELFSQEINNSVEFLQDYLSDENIFYKVLVEQGLWPKEIEIGGKDPYEFFGMLDKTKKIGFVYFIRNDDIYKIGITDNLMRRMKELQADEIINSVRCVNYESLEKELHKEFKKYRIPQSEYFRLTPELVDAVNKKLIEKAIQK